MTCKASIISVIYVVNFTQNAELFLQKKGPPSANAEGFFCLPEDEKKQKNKNFGSTARTRDLKFAVHRSNHYAITPSLESGLKTAYIKKT